MTQSSIQFASATAAIAGPAAIERVDALALLFHPKVINGSYVLSSGGGTYDGTYPPAAFAVRKHFFGSTVPSDGTLTLTTIGGRSSNLDLPFYFVHNGDQSAGLFVGIGWTGQWSSTISARLRQFAFSDGGDAAARWNS